MVLGLLPIIQVTAATGKDVTLMSLTRTAAASADSGNQFNADSGVYASVSTLTAWSNSVQVDIGGTGRTPVVINHGGRKWQTAQEDGINNASAFQIKFKTVDYENIRFSCRQKSTASGPDFFSLAYRIGAQGGFTAIPGSYAGSVNITGSSNDTYSAYDDPVKNTTSTYTSFVLPVEMEDEDEVYLRIYVDGPTSVGAGSGNTSINNILITGD